MRIKINISLKVGRVVKYFTLADLVLLAGWGLIQPIFAIFVIERIMGATVITVGIAAAIYWVLKSILQLPIAKYLDKHPGEADDFKALVTGLFITAFSALAFIIINQPWQLYLIQAIHAVGFALYVPSWSAIFSRHLDKDKVSFDWALNSTVVGLAAGVGGFLGGVIVSWTGFPAIFILGAILSMGSAIILLAVPDLVLPGKIQDRIPMMRDHRPHNVPR